MDIFQNQCILKAEFRFGIFGFGSANLTEISVSVVSVFTRFGRPLGNPLVDSNIENDLLNNSQSEKMT